jgi:hypothetical protein
VNDFDSDKNKWKWLIYSNILACNHQFFMSSSSLYEIMYFFEKKSANN